MTSTTAINAQHGVKSVAFAAQHSKADFDVD
jgi:hypothetical protein